jgi:hypothetical protein
MRSFEDIRFRELSAAASMAFNTDGSNTMALKGLSIVQLTAIPVCSPWLERE